MNQKLLEALGGLLWGTVKAIRAEGEKALHLKVMHSREQEVLEGDGGSTPLWKWHGAGLWNSAPVPECPSKASP